MCLAPGPPPGPIVGLDPPIVACPGSMLSLPPIPFAVCIPIDPLTPSPLGLSCVNVCLFLGNRDAGMFESLCEANYKVASPTLLELESLVSIE